MAVSERTQIMRYNIANINNIKKECIGEMAPVPNKPHTHYTAHLQNNTQLILLKNTPIWHRNLRIANCTTTTHLLYRQESLQKGKLFV